MVGTFGILKIQIDCISTYSITVLLDLRCNKNVQYYENRIKITVGRYIKSEYTVSYIQCTSD